MPVVLDRRGRRYWRGVGLEKDLLLNPDQLRKVQALYAKERDKHAAIERVMREMPERVPGARLEGLEYSMKTEESLCRKVADQVLREGKGIDDVLSNMKDIHRYTIVADRKPWTDVTGQVIGRLASEHGMNAMKRLDTFGSPTYKGFNYVADRPSPPGGSPASGDSSSSLAKAALTADTEQVSLDILDPKRGYRFEVQFHTPASIAVKNDIHPIYEAQRVFDAKDANQKREMDNAFNYLLYKAYERNGVKSPPGHERLGGGTVVQPRPPSPSDQALRHAIDLVNSQVGGKYEFKKVAPSESSSDSSKARVDPATSTVYPWESSAYSSASESSNGRLNQAISVTRIDVASLASAVAADNPHSEQEWRATAPSNYYAGGYPAQTAGYPAQAPSSFGQQQAAYAYPSTYAGYPAQTAGYPAQTAGYPAQAPSSFGQQQAAYAYPSTYGQGGGSQPQPGHRSVPTSTATTSTWQQNIPGASTGATQAKRAPSPGGR